MEQCFWYLFTFVLTHISSITNRLVGLLLGESKYALLIMHTIFDPMQGFLNLLVYRRPLYMRYRRLLPELPRWQCWYRALRWHFTFDLESERREILASQMRRRTTKNTANNNNNTPNKSGSGSGGAGRAGGESDNNNNNTMNNSTNNSKPQGGAGMSSDAGMSGNSWGKLGFSSVETHQPESAKAEIPAESYLEPETAMEQRHPPGSRVGAGAPGGNSTGRIEIEKDWGDVGFSTVAPLDRDTYAVQEGDHEDGSERPAVKEEVFREEN